MPQPMSIASALSQFPNPAEASLNYFEFIAEVHVIEMITRSGVSRVCGRLPSATE